VATSFNGNITPLHPRVFFAAILGLPIDSNLHWQAFFDTLPPAPYHFGIGSSTHATSEEEKVCRRCSLNRRTKSSLRRHRYGSDDMVADLSAGWSL
jgi:hypothetical protein